MLDIWRLPDDDTKQTWAFMIRNPATGQGAKVDVKKADALYAIANSGVTSHVNIHNAAMQWAGRYALDTYGPQLAPGETFHEYDPLGDPSSRPGPQSIGEYHPLSNNGAE